MSCVINDRLKYQYVEDHYKEWPDLLNSVSEPMDNYIKKAFQNTSLYTVGSFIKDNIVDIDKALEQKFDIYKSTKEYLHNITHSEPVKQFKHWINSENFHFRDIEDKLLTTYQHATEYRNKISDGLVSDLDDKLKVKFTQSEIKDLNTMYGISGMFNLAGSLNNTSSYYMELMHGVPIDKLIEANGLDKDGKAYTEYAKNLASLFTGQSLADNKVRLNKNLDIMKDNPELYNRIQRHATLLVLKSIPNINSLITKLNSNPDIKDELFLASQSMQTMYNDMLKDTKDKDFMVHNLAIDVYNKSNEIKVVSLQNLNDAKFLERDGWKVLREPTKDRLGLVYRDMNIAKQEGVGTHMNYNLNLPIIDYKLGKDYISTDPNIVQTSTKDGLDTYLLSLTKDEKQTLGLIENPAHTLYRTISKYKFIKDTQIIRNCLLTDGLTYKLDTRDDNSIKGITDLIKKDEHPFFIKVTNPFIYGKLDPSIKEEYKQVTNASNISGFKEGITLVRKDISPWLMGYNKLQFNDHRINKILHIAQELVLMGKTRVVMNSPIKLLHDTISNILLLSTKGVPLGNIIAETPKINKQLLELQQLKNKYALLQIQVLTDPKKEPLLKQTEQQMRNHPLAFAYFSGMQQSLTTDIMTKNFDTVSGLQKDVNSILTKILYKSDKETKNNLGKIISWYMHVGSKQGLTSDNLLRKLASIKDGGIISETVKEIANNIKRNRDNDDIIRFMNNFLNTPSNEVTKAGGATMQYTDEISRIILYRHLRHRGYSDREAIRQAMDTFIDYRKTMPKYLQFLSDTFMIPFPHYLLKVNKLILSLIKSKPTRAIAQLDMDFLKPSLDDTNIFGSNLIEKYMKNRIISNPLDIMDVFTYF